MTHIEKRKNVGVDNAPPTAGPSEVSAGINLWAESVVSLEDAITSLKPKNALKSWLIWTPWHELIFLVYFVIHI